MNINIYVNGLESLSSIEFYTTGEMQGYILAAYWSDEVGEVDICFRVYNPDDGEAENIITWTSKGIAEEKRKAIEFHLAHIAEKCGLKKAIGLKNPNDELISFTEININDHEYSFGINRDTWYDLDRWEILAKVSTYLKARKAKNKHDSTWSRLVFEDFAVKGEWLEAAMKITGSSEIYVKSSVTALLMEGNGYTIVLMPIKNTETDKNTGEEKRMPITDFEEI